MTVTSLADASDSLRQMCPAAGVGRFSEHSELLTITFVALQRAVSPLVMQKVLDRPAHVFPELLTIRLVALQRAVPPLVMQKVLDRPAHVFPQLVTTRSFVALQTAFPT